MSQTLTGQISIRPETTAEETEMTLPETERFITPNLEQIDYRTDAMAQAERKRLRLERNKIELNVGLTAMQTYFENWASGGDNTFSGLTTLYFMHQYKKDKITVTSKFDGRYGMVIIDTTVFKNEDKYTISSQIERSINKKWAYAGGVTFRSQIAKGYKSRTDKTLVSAFMSPGILDLSLGFTFNPEKSPWKITLSPVTGSVLFVLNDELSNEAKYGIDAGKHIKPTVGPSVNIDFDLKFARNDALRYKSNFYSFYNFNNEPLSRWENTFTMQATKWLATNIYWYFVYDSEVATPRGWNKLQITYSVGVTLTFNYKNQ